MRTTENSTPADTPIARPHQRHAGRFSAQAKKYRVNIEYPAPAWPLGKAPPALARTHVHQCSGYGV